jgi:UDPglucose 6-dehydrogenase
LVEGVAHGLFQFIAVGTPPDEDGSADLQHVRAVARSIGQHLDEYRVVVNKSTVPVGTAGVVYETIAAVLAERGGHSVFGGFQPGIPQGRRGVQDFMRPDRIIIGSECHRATVQLRNLYAPFNRNSRPHLIEMDVRSAELTKYAANAMLATKISFMNEIANLAERFWAPTSRKCGSASAPTRASATTSSIRARIRRFLFPKDVKALEYTARSVHYEATLLQAVEAVNEQQKTVLFTKIQRHFRNNLRGRTFASVGTGVQTGHR